MRHLIILCFLLLPAACFSQGLTLDMSNPQPRLGEDFTLTIGMDSVASKLFSNIPGNFKISSFADIYGSKSQLSVNMHALKLGKNTIGPMKLNINNQLYTTNKLTFDIVDSLPAVDQGIWIRVVPINDTSDYVLLEQRIPALKYTSHTNNSISTTTKTNDDIKEIAITTDGIQGLSFNGSQSQMQEIYPTATRGDLNFKYFFAVYKLNKPDKTKPVVLMKKDFTDLPDYYVFKNVVIP